MDFNKLGKGITSLGFAGMLLCAIWWFSFYTEVNRFMGMPPSAIWDQEVMRCMVVNSGPCGLVSGIANAAGTFAYQAQFMWLSVAVVLVGLVIGYASNGKP